MNKEYADNILNNMTKAVKTQINELDDTLLHFPYISDFVLTVLSPLEGYKNHDSQVVDRLHTLLWQISGYDFSTALTNPCHRDSNVIYELNSFIGNYLLDDAAFYVHKELFGWKAQSSGNDDPWYQNPAILIEAAKENANFIDMIENVADKKERRDLYIKGMVSSGVVESLLV